MEQLSAAERHVIELVLRGATNREIAAVRGTAMRTVANLLARAYRKLGVASRRELVAKFARCACTGERPQPALGKREREIVERLARGAANKAIAHDLGLSPSTIAGYLADIRRKLGVRSNLEIVVAISKNACTSGCNVERWSDAAPSTTSRTRRRASRHDR